MAEKHPYTQGSGALFQTISHLRKTFPAAGVTAETLRKLGLAPKNESYVINTLRFVGVIDDEGKRTAAAIKPFTQHDDAQFQQAFGQMVKSAYSVLFDLHSDAWDLDLDALTQFFRTNDQTSSVVGRRQASTFQALASLSGHSEAPTAAAKKGTKTKVPKTKATTTAKEKKIEKTEGGGGGGGGNGGKRPRDVGLTVRVEVNLPAEGTKETYDAIFRSIRENLIDAE